MIENLPFDDLAALVGRASADIQRGDTGSPTGRTRVLTFGLLAASSGVLIGASSGS
ncbi:hypothetical protein [Parafrankia soli]|uniref:hypothetical protein n=1 Tax=Parafrankia soli TaxID=2599596 RepID=UPI0012FF5C53|nr:hypothetical protein [Parafrankia soli]